jgi:hypothetical protein
MIDFTEYDSILENCKDENDVQRYLEENSNLLPVNNWLLGHQVHCSLLISKFKFGNEYISDFVYLTKCSDEWYVVFVEIENPKKKIFTNDNHFTSEFNHAYEQVQDWERYLNDSNNKINILNSLKHIRHSMIMRDNNVSFKYLLIYGRKDDRDKTKERMDKFLQKKTSNIKVCTFDSIKSVTIEFSHYMVLSPKGDDKFEVKSVPNDFDNNDQGFFGRYTSENISINKKCLLQLIDLGYDMMSWLEGKPLKLNCKCVGNQSKR